MVLRTSFGQVVTADGGFAKGRCSVCGDECSKGIEIENRKGVFCSWDCEERCTRERKKDASKDEA